MMSDDAEQRAGALLRTQGPICTRELARLRSRDGFSVAVRDASVKVQKLHQGKRLLNLIINDRGRFAASLIALDLHFRREANGIGLTSGRLKQLLFETGVCSPTRAGALLALMQLGNFVRPARPTRDRRVRELKPTEKLIASQRERWRCQLESAGMFLPHAAAALEHLDDDDFLGAMVRACAGYFYGGFRMTAGVPDITLFAARQGGMFVVVSLLAEADGEALAGTQAVRISVSELARRTGTSRTHIIKLLNDAAAEGLLERPAQSEVRLTPRFVDAAHDFFAQGYLLLDHCAGQVLPTRRVSEVR